MFKKGPFNIMVYSDCNIDQKTGVEFHLTTIEKFDKNEKCIYTRHLYINGETEVIKSYFQGLKIDEIDDLCKRTKNNQNFQCKREIRLSPMHC